ncbi:MAG: DUF554 domain-containing protein [Dermatophilus congolensis]|nr:DUF554 domain-containing protein [Dermatophilus congolensis]
MESYIPGTGTFLNTLTVLVGGLLGMTIGHRLPERTRSVVTDCLGLVTLLMAALSTADVLNPTLDAAVAPISPVLIVLGALLIGGIIGSLLRIEERLENMAGWVHGLMTRRRSRAGVRVSAGGSTDVVTDGQLNSGEAVSSESSAAHAARRRFIDGWLTTTLLFCVGPLTIIGSLSDGMGRGYDELAVKAVLDGFAALAFAATYGVGVLASAGSVLVIQGTLTLIGAWLGTLMPEPHIAALTATGGLMLAALAFRLLRIRDIPVGDLLPALAVAPLLVSFVQLFT